MHVLHARFLFLTFLYFVVLLKQGGGGPFAVLPYNKPGRFVRGGPLVSGHTASVLDFDFNPFHEQVSGQPRSIFRS